MKNIRELNKDYLKRNQTAINYAYKKDTSIMRRTIDWFNNLFTTHSNIHWLVPLLIMVVLLSLSGCQDNKGNERGTAEHVEQYYLDEMLPKGSTILSISNIGNYQYDPTEVFVKFYFENECFIIYGSDKYDSGITKVDCP